MIPRPTEVPAEHHALRILVVEDNLLIAETICDLVADCGCIVIGPAPDLSQGLALIDQNPPDGALLDINLGGDLSFSARQGPGRTGRALYLHDGL
jgi:CheY-like chemotaxis protein